MAADAKFSLTGKADVSAIRDVQKAMKDMSDTVKNVGSTITKVLGVGSAVVAVKKLAKFADESTAAFIKQQKAVGNSTAAFDAAEKKYSAAIGNIKAGIGGMFAGLKMTAMEKIQPVLDGVAKWFAENGQKITGFILGLPQIFVSVGQFIGKLFMRLFANPQFFVVFAKNAFAIIVGAFKLVGQAILDYWKGLFVTVGEVIIWALSNAAAGIYNIFASLVHNIKGFFIDMLNGIAEKINGLTGIINEALPKNLQIGAIGKIENSATPPKKEGQKLNTESIASAWKNVGADFMKNLGGIVDSAKNVAAAFDDVTSDLVGELKGKVGGIIEASTPNLAGSGMEKANALQDAYYAGLLRTADARAKEELRIMHAIEARRKAEAEAEKEANSFFGRVRSAFQELAPAVKSLIPDEFKQKAKEATQAISNMIAGGPMGVIDTIIGGLFKALMSLESFQKILDPIGTILGAMMEILGPMINTIFMPLVSIMETVGELLGNLLVPVFMLLEAVLTPVFAVIQLLLDALKPVIEMIQQILIPIIDVVTAVLAPVFDVLQLIFDALAPLQTVMMVIFDALSPFLQIFGILAQLFIQLNPVLLILTGALKVFGIAISWVAEKIIMPVVNFFKGIIDGIIDFINGVIKLINKIPFVNIKTISKSSGDSAYKSLGVAQDNKTDSPKAASYTAARDVYVTINFANSFVNGDAREIALMLRDEIALAEAMGR